jgi:hypothetical protein
MADESISQRLNNLLQELEQTKQILQNQSIPEDTRNNLVKATKSLLNHLEEPKDIILNYAYQVSCERVCEVKKPSKCHRWEPSECPFESVLI